MGHLNTAESKEEIRYKTMKFILESFDSTLSVLNDVMDLGYLDSSMSQNLMILATLLLYVESGDKQDAGRSPQLFIRFLIEVKGHDELIANLNELLCKAVQTLKITAKMRENVQMLVLLKLYRKYETSSKEMKSSLDEVFGVLSLENSGTDPKDLNGQLNSLLCKQLEQCPIFTKKMLEDEEKVNEEAHLDYVAKIKQEIKSFSMITVSLDLILKRIVFNISKKDLEIYSAVRQKNSKYLSDVEYVGGQIDSLKLGQFIQVSILDVITNYYNQRFTILQKLLNVEIIYGEDEKQIYQKYTKNVDADSLSVENLASLVSGLITIDPRFKDKPDSDLTEYKRKIAYIEDFLAAVTKDMKLKYNLKMDFKKTQNLLKNKGYHLQVLRLFKLNFQKAEHTNLFKLIVDFLVLFCDYNTSIKRLLAPHMNDFVDLIGWGIDSAKLVSTISQGEVDPRVTSNHIDYIFNKINQIVASESMQSIFNLRTSRKKPDFDISPPMVDCLNMLLRYKRMLSGMIFNDKNFRREDSQRKIIFCLVNNKELVKIYEFKYFNEIKHMLMQSKDTKEYKLDKYLTFYDFYSAYLSLLAEASWEFTGGIDQARRVVTKEQLLEVLTSPNTPIKFKKHFLKCFHHVAVY